jgi:hypothetical protein
VNVEQVAAGKMLFEFPAKLARQEEPLPVCQTIGNVLAVADAYPLNLLSSGRGPRRQDTNFVPMIRESSRQFESCARRPAVVPVWIEVRGDESDSHRRIMPPL